MSMIINPYAFGGGGGGGPGGDTYNDAVDSYNPGLLHRMDEETGMFAADSSGNGHIATSVSDFSGVGVSIVAPSGFAGLGRGAINFCNTTTGHADLAFGGNPTGGWGWLVWITGCAGGAQYVTARGNDLAMIYKYAGDNVELFSSGADTRTDSQIPLDSSDIVTPHMIYYGYLNGVLTCWKDDAEVRSISRSITLPTSVQRISTGGVDGGAGFNGTTFENQAHFTAPLSPAQLTTLWDRRDVAA